MTDYEKLGKALMRVVETVLPESYIEMSELSMDQLEKAAEAYCHMAVLNPHYGCVAESIPNNPDTVMEILKDLKTRTIRDFSESTDNDIKSAILADEDGVWQGVLNYFYAKWQAGEYSDYADMVYAAKEIDDIYAFLILVGKFNQQVNNGGISQYFNNYYASEDGDMRDTELLDLTVLLAKQYLSYGNPEFDGFLAVLRDVMDNTGEWQDDCSNCGGSGEVEEEYEVDEEDEDGEVYTSTEYENVTCDYCRGDGVEGDIYFTITSPSAEREIDNAFYALESFEDDMGKKAEELVNSISGGKLTESKASETKKARKEVLEYLKNHPITIDLAKDGLDYYLAPSAIEKCASASNSLDAFKQKIETKIKEDDYYITSTYGDVLDHFESFDYDILSTDQIATMVKKNIVFNLKGLDKEASKWFN